MHPKVNKWTAEILGRLYKNFPKKTVLCPENIDNNADLEEQIIIADLIQWLKIRKQRPFRVFFRSIFNPQRLCSFKSNPRPVKAKTKHRRIFNPNSKKSFSKHIKSSYYNLTTSIFERFIK